MSTRSHYGIRQSMIGPDDAGMDLRAARLHAHKNQEVKASAALPWLDWQLSLFVILCAIAGAILFAFLILLWLRKQMSREKDSEDGDRRSLVEEGAGCLPERGAKHPRPITEAHWIHEPIVKTIVPAQSSCSITISSSIPTNTTTTTTASGLPEAMSVVQAERRAEPARVRVKGLLERRGSSASLTIDINSAPESPPKLITPTDECTAEEFLLSAGNVLSRAQLNKVVSDPLSLKKEFYEVPLNQPERIEVPGSGIKNRYRSVLPNARSRVILPGSDDPLTSYINANYIRGYDEDVRYIATQGPLAHTVQDFWKMVWSENSQVVVMMTKLLEKDSAKCDVYFPFDNNDRIQAGPFTILAMAIDSRNGYTIRTLELRYEQERRFVQHYWYDSWPDHGVPQSADPLISLAAEVNTKSGPIVVHCSAGIGRTGCFIALATGITQLTKDNNVDVLGILCQMRYDRGGMVQTADQYEFVHRALCLFEQTLVDSRTASDS